MLCRSLLLPAVPKPLGAPHHTEGEQGTLKCRVLFLCCHREGKGLSPSLHPLSEKLRNVLEISKIILEILVDTSSPHSLNFLT